MQIKGTSEELLQSNKIDLFEIDYLKLGVTTLNQLYNAQLTKKPKPEIATKRPDGIFLKKGGGNSSDYRIQNAF